MQHVPNGINQISASKPVRKLISNVDVLSGGNTYKNDNTIKLQNLFVGNSKNEGAVEGTTRTAGTADTTHKTFDSANNSNSIKGARVAPKGAFS